LAFQFVEDVKRTVQATGIFCFFPMQYWNDNGIANSASYLSTMLKTDGAPNDVLNNFNPLAIILFSPILNFALYPALRKAKIHYGPIKRICTGFFLAMCAGIGYTVLQHYAYMASPCGVYGSSEDRCVEEGLTADISVWWMGLPYAVGGISELFVNVPAFGIAYSRSPVNMRGVVSGINLLNTAFAYLINLALSDVVKDPNLVWCFGGPVIVLAVTTVIFWFTFKHIDKEEYVLSTQVDTTEHDSTGTSKFIVPNAHNQTTNHAAPIAENEAYGISQKQ